MTKLSNINSQSKPADCSAVQFDTSYHVQASPQPFVQVVGKQIHDDANQRTITLSHTNASDTVLWNPWHNTPSAMHDDAYKEMLCLETARINRKLQAGEALSVEIVVSKNSHRINFPLRED